MINHWLKMFQAPDGVIRYEGFSIEIQPDGSILLDSIRTTTTNLFSSDDKNVDELLEELCEIGGWEEPWWASYKKELDKIFGGNWEGYTDPAIVVGTFGVLKLELSEAYRGTLQGRVYLDDPPNTLEATGTYVAEDWSQDEPLKLVEHLRSVGRSIWGKQ